MYTRLKAVPVFFFFFVLSAWFALYLAPDPNETIRDVDGREKYDKPRELQKWFFEQRAYPEEKIPENAYEQGIAHVRRMERSPMHKKSGGWTWVPLGPTNIAGRIRDLIVDPRDPNIVYIGAAGGGIWKSTNEGVTWRALTDFLPNLRINSLDIHPTNSRVLIAGCGEGWVVWQGGTMWGKGIYRTDDAGENWYLIPSTNTNAFQYVYDVAFDPFNPVNILAATSAGVYRSSDDGATWGRRLPFSTATALQVIFSKTTPNLAYAVLNARGVNKSTDGGVTWTDITTGNSVIDVQGYTRIQIAVAPSNSDIVMASYIDHTSEACIGMYKTTNGGSSWMRIGIPTNEYNNDTYVGSQGTFNNIIAFHPTDPDIAYAGGIDLYRTNNGGISWSRISNSYTPFGVFVHPDHHAIDFHPTNHRVMYFGNDGGIVRSANAGGGYETRNSGLSITQFHSVAPHPTADRVLGGTIDNGNLMTTIGTEFNDVTGGDGGFAIIDNSNPQYVYAEIYFLTFYRSTNGGLRFGDYKKMMNGIPLAAPTHPQYPGTSDPVNFFAPFEIDPNDPSTLYAGTYRLFKTTDRASTWTPITGNISISGVLSTIAIAKAESRVIYCGTTGGNVTVTTDGGSNWGSIRGGLPNRYVTDLAIDQVDPGIAYVCFSGFGSGHVWKTTNYGQSWTDISGSGTTGLPDVPANTIAIHPVNRNRLYVGTDLGAFESSDGGSTWMIINSEMGNVTVSDLRFRPDGTLFAATHGRGIFKSSYSLLDSQNLAAPTLFRLEQNFPNPFNPGTYIRYQIGTKTHVALQVFNLQGRLVRTLVDREQFPGMYTVEFDGRSFASGVYLYRLSIPGRSDTKSMVMVK